MKRIGQLLILCTLALSGCVTSGSQMSNKVSIKGFKRDNDEFSIKIDNDVETFSFINIVETPKDCNWSLYYDFEGTKEVKTKTIQCSLGNNKLYLLVANSKETIGFYSVNVYRYHMYTVSFNTNGGTSIPSQKVQEESLVAKVDDPVKTGYTFMGWDYDFNQPVMRNLTITANWNSNTYMINFDPNGGDLDITSMKVAFGRNVDLPTPVLTGYTFLGWYEGTTKYVSGIWNHAKDVNLKASWKLSIFSITFDLNGGSMTEDTHQTITYGSQLTLPTPTRKGYSFLGWFDKDGNQLIDCIWTLESDIRVDAKWQANTYTIELEVNGGDALDKTIVSMTYDSDYSVPIPTKEGYDFIGWFDEQGNKIAVTGIWENDLAKKLTARWEPHSYIIHPAVPSSACGNVSSHDEIDVGSTQLSEYKVIYHISDDETKTKIYRVNDPLNEKNIFIPESTDGHFFAGWYLDKEYTKPFSIQSGIKILELNLYSKWEEKTDYYSSMSQFQNADGIERSITIGNNKSQYCVVIPASGNYKVTIKTYVEYNSPNGYCTIFLRNRSVSSTVLKTWSSDYSNKVASGYYKSFFNCGDILQITYYTYDLYLKKYTMTAECLDNLLISKDAETNSLNVRYDENFYFGLPLINDGEIFNGWYSDENGNGIKLTDENGIGISKWKYTDVNKIYPYITQ